MTNVTVKEFSLENSTVLINGTCARINHTRLLSRDGKRLQKCRIHSATVALSNDTAKAIRTAISKEAERVTAQYRSLRNASKAA